jgi:16S rRNA (cytidine1402-2'-O)-methyltransferase
VGMAATEWGKLYLLPTLLGGDDMDIIPAQTRQITLSLKHFIVEDIRTTRRYLVKLGIKEQGISIDDLTLQALDKHTITDIAQIDAWLQPIFSGNSIGIMSEAGCPAIADPGNVVVKRAHEMGIEVVPLAGTSSLLLTLMASGMNGQNFAFNGYLPISNSERQQRIRELEQRARRDQQTQLFIETPYRNNVLFAELLQICPSEMRLCVAAQLTLPDQYIRTLSIAQWRKVEPIPNWHKKMIVFALSI